MPSRFSSLPLLCAAVLILGGCAGLGHKPAPAPADTVASAAPAPATSLPPSSATVAPAATTANPAAGADSATPIPDLDDNSPQIQWEDLSITPAESKYDNLWNYLGQHFSLPESGGDGRVEGELKWFESHGPYLQRMANRAKPYLYYIVQQIKARHMPLDIALLPVVESAYDPFAYSRGRASGLWQFISSTGRLWDLKQDWWYDARRDVLASTNAALDYLQFLNKEFNGDWLLALAAYNSGGGTVTRAIQRNERRGLPTDFWDLDLPAETRAYVPRLLAICKLVATPGFDGVDLPPIPNKPYFAAVNTGGQIDLATAAKLAGITTEQMYLLNPGFNRWATDPNGPDQLLVPLDKESQFTQGLAALPASERVQWATHRVRSGDVLGAIARENHTTVAVLQRVNGIHGSLIHPGQVLLIPMGRNTLADATLVAEQRVAHTSRFGNSREVPARSTVHRVRNGESLWTIAQRYHVSVAQLAEWNGISPHGLLHVGQKLAIRPRRSVARITADNAQSGTALVAAQQSEASDSSQGGSRGTAEHRVQNGESLWTIAQRYHVSVAQLAKWNGLDRHGVLHAGQELAIRAPDSDSTTTETASSGTPSEAAGGGHKLFYTVHSGDSLYSISSRYDVSVSSIANWNNLDPDDYLHPGQRLELYVEADSTSAGS